VIRLDSELESHVNKAFQSRQAGWAFERHLNPCLTRVESADTLEPGGRYFFNAVPTTFKPTASRHPSGETEPSDIQARVLLHSSDSRNPQARYTSHHMLSRAAYGGSRGKIVLGFDVGTTYSGISYRQVDSHHLLNSGGH